MSQAEVSLIIVNLNGLEHLETLFGSIRELSFPQDSIEIKYFTCFERLIKIVSEKFGIDRMFESQGHVKCWGSGG